MEPNLPTPHGSPEIGPHMAQPESTSPGGSEQYRAPEKHDSTEHKTGHGSGENTTHTPTQPAPFIPLPPMPDPTAQQPSATIQGTPSVAADEDVMEKEWVEKAKKVIAETKHDPYLQEQAVSRLQADYLQKRYGKTVKLPDEG